VRNLERGDYSFWLATSTDKFYPDFVALLNNGRILIVEYKGGHIAETPDTKEKDIIGQIWASRSKGRCIFRTVVKENYRTEIKTEIKTAIENR
jgi:type III restriction enzyme